MGVNRMRHFSRTFLGAAVIALIAAACSSTSSPTSSQTPGGSTSRASGSGVTVNLVVTGNHPATIQGTKGTCNRGATSGMYFFEAKDYPSLGTNGVFQVSYNPGASGTETKAIKAVIDGKGALEFSTQPGVTITFSADHKHVDIDSDLKPDLGHVKGTIDCS